MFHRLLIAAILLLMPTTSLVAGEARKRFDQVG
jgi:hypothetical protein